MSKMLFVLLAISVLVTYADDAQSEEMKRSALTSIGAVSSLDAEPDPDDPGIGGGFDFVSYFRNRYIPKLAQCSDQIAKVYVDWSKTQKLNIPFKEVGNGSLLIHATNPELNGLFELTYRVNTKKERARVTVYYFSANGDRHSPSSIKAMLTKWEIAKLQDELDTALACGKA